MQSICIYHKSELNLLEAEVIRFIHACIDADLQTQVHKTASISRDKVWSAGRARVVLAIASCLYSYAKNVRTMSCSSMIYSICMASQILSKSACRLKSQ